MGGDPKAIGERINDSSYDDPLYNISISILTQNISLCMLVAPLAESLGIYIWHCLVGDCSEHDCLFCRIACK